MRHVRFPRFRGFTILALLSAFLFLLGCKESRRSEGEKPRVEFDDKGKMLTTTPVDVVSELPDSEKHLAPKEEFVGGVVPNERKAQKLVNQLSNYTMAICADMLECPENFDALRKELKERYKLNWPNDPWGKPYVYTRTEASKFSIVSWGPDMVEGSADDIKISEMNK